MVYVLIILLGIILALPAVLCLFATGIAAAIGGVAIFCWLGLLYLAIDEWRQSKKDSSRHWDDLT